MLQKKPSNSRKIHSSSHTMPIPNRPAHIKATLGDRSFSFASVCSSIPNDVMCAPSHSSSVSFEDILVSFSLQRLMFLFDHCTCVHGLYIYGLYMVLYMMLALLNAVCIIFLFFAVEFYIVIYVNAFCFNVLYLGYQHSLFISNITLYQLQCF